MKTATLPILLVLVAVGGSCRKAGQTVEEGGQAGKSRVSKSHMEALEAHEARRADFAMRFNAEKQRRREFARHLESAKLLFQKRDIKAALVELDEAADLSVNDPDVQNLRGSCYVEMRDFDQALEAFEMAAEARKDNPSIQFNIGEVYFVTKRWQEALDVFEKVGGQLPPENTALARLVEFRVLLCMKQLGRNAEALALADRHDVQDESPYHWYAKAALAFDEGKPELAGEWLAAAAKRFPDPNDRAPWQDTLVEYGSIKEFDP
jgi:tetratricopeptide (TPR) repeat protein